MISISPVTNNFKIRNDNISSYRLNFHGIENDLYESSPKTTLYNPEQHCYGSAIIPKDLTKPAKIILATNPPVDLDYNPNRFDYLTDKQNGGKIKTMILKSDENLLRTTYHFLSENLDKEYGYVSFIKCQNPKFFNYTFPELLEDKPNEGLIGGRLIVDYLQNYEDKKIGGIGLLADKLSVKCCMENNLPLNIVSVADRGSHAAHYIRGKRFYSVNPSDSYRCDYLQDLYGKTDINEILKDLINDPKLKGKKIKPNLSFLPMYMPKELIMKYIEELNHHPIL